MDLIKDAVLLNQVSQNHPILVDLLKANPTVLAQFVALAKKQQAANLTTQIAALQAQQAALNAP